MKQKILIFDLDGVIVDTEEMASEYLLGKYPTVTKEMMSEVLAGNFHEGMAKIKLLHPHAPMTEEEIIARKMAYSEKKLTAVLFNGILELVKRLHEKGYTLVVNTSALERNCTPLLKKLQIYNFFDYIATAEMSKNKTVKFKMIEEKYNASNENTIFITDTLGDVREAKAAGVPTIAVTWGAHDRSFFTREANDNLIAIVDSIEELEKILIKQ